MQALRTAGVHRQQWRKSKLDRGSGVHNIEEIIWRFERSSRIYWRGVFSPNFCIDLGLVDRSNGLWPSTREEAGGNF